jgi:hypothetical protein
VLCGISFPVTSALQRKCGREHSLSKDRAQCNQQQKRRNVTTDISMQVKTMNGQGRTEQAQFRTSQPTRFALIMMILHQRRHGRQDNHATNHVRCTKPRQAGQIRRHIERESSLQVTKATYSGLQEHRIIVYTATGQKAKPKAYRGINKAKPYTSETCAEQRLPSKAVEKHPVNAYGGKATAMHGRKGTWMRTNKKG